MVNILPDLPTDGDFEKTITAMCKHLNCDNPKVSGNSSKAEQLHLALTIKSVFETCRLIVEEKDKQIKLLEERIIKLENATTIPSTNTNKLMADLFKQKPTEAKAIVLSEVIRENKIATKKANNIIIFGVAESGEKDIESRIAEDKNKVEEILQEIGSEPNVISRVTRINKKTPTTSKNNNETKPGPIIVELKIDNRTKILKAAKILKNSTTYKNVFIGPDMTIAQRIMHKKLLEERNKKNNEIRDENGQITGEFYYGIRDEKVVKINAKKSNQIEYN